MRQGNSETVQQCDATVRCKQMIVGRHYCYKERTSILEHVYASDAPTPLHQIDF